MDYNYSNQQETLYKKNLDVKGLILNILCLIMALITTASTFMPLIKMEYDGNIDLIDICKCIGGLFEPNFSGFNIGEIIIYILLIVAILLPILITILGIIFTIIYVVRLATQSFVKKASGFAKVILTIEMIFSLLSMIMTSFVMSESGIYGYSSSNVYMSFGWYLPVIFAIIILLVEYIYNVAGMIKNSSEKSKDITTAIFGLIGFIVSIVIYMAFALTQFSFQESGEAFELPSSFLFYSIARTVSFMIMGYNDMFIIYHLSMMFIILITILARVSISKNLKITRKKKFSAVFSIVAGLSTLILAIVNYVIFSLDLEEVKFGAAMYIYIILGIVLTILGITYMCIKSTWNNTETMAVNVQYQNQMQYQNQPQRYDGNHQ